MVVEQELQLSVAFVAKMPHDIAIWDENFSLKLLSCSKFPYFKLKVQKHTDPVL